MEHEHKDNLASWAGDLGVEVSRDQVEDLSVFIDELLQWDRRVNLAGPSSCEGIVRELLLDCLLASSLLPYHGTVLDIGSGAGFPGIPLLIHGPGRRGHLVEAHSKKVAFLKHVLRLTHITRAVVIRGRLEDVSSGLKAEGYDMVTARALAPLPNSIRLCAPYVTTGGVFVSFQGPRIEEQLMKNSGLIKESGLVIDRTYSYTLPGKREKRTLLFFRKAS